MDQIEVTAHFDRDGKIVPVRFFWRGEDYPVSSTGRSWQDESGQHYLVMLPDDRVFELIYQPDSFRWYLNLPGQAPRAA